MKKKQIKRKKRKLSTYWRVPYKTRGVQITMNKRTYDILAKKAAESGMYLPQYIRYLIEKRILGMDRPGINNDEWVWNKVVPDYFDRIYGGHETDEVDDTARGKRE